MNTWEWVDKREYWLVVAFVDKLDRLAVQKQKKNWIMEFFSQLF